jgi:hypothetical protein
MSICCTLDGQLQRFCIYGDTSWWSNLHSRPTTFLQTLCLCKFAIRMDISTSRYIVAATQQERCFVPIDGSDRADSSNCARGGIRRIKPPILASFHMTGAGLLLWPNFEVIHSIV